MYREKTDGKGRRWRKRKMEAEEGWMDGWMEAEEREDEEGAAVDKLKRHIFFLKRRRLQL